MGTLMRAPDEMDPALAERIALNDAAGAATAQQDMANARRGLLPESMRVQKLHAPGSDPATLGLPASNTRGIQDEDELPCYSPAAAPGEQGLFGVWMTVVLRRLAHRSIVTGDFMQLAREYVLMKLAHMISLLRCMPCKLTNQFRHNLH